MSMSTQTFDARLTHIEEQTRARQERVDGYRDQQMARLFVESGWSQQKLAEHLGKKWGKEVVQQWVSYHLRLGRFIQFFTTVSCKEWRLPLNLTEWKFRKLWESTNSDGDYRGHKANTEAAKADEGRRFGIVLEELKSAGMSRAKKPVRRALLEKVAGKGWMTCHEMADAVGKIGGHPVPAQDVFDSLRRLVPTEKAPYRVERTGEGLDAKYRIVRVKGLIPSKKQISALAPQLVPMLDLIIREAQKPRVEVSLSALCDLASKIKKVVEAAGLTAESTPVSES